MSTAAPAIRAALLELVRTALDGDPAHVCAGHPGTYQPNDIVAVGISSDAQSEMGPLSPSRKREETVSLSLTISCYRGGGNEVAELVADRAFELLATIEAALRTDYSIGGTCRFAALTAWRADEAVDEDILAMGRVTEIVATITCQSRI